MKAKEDYFSQFVLDYGRGFKVVIDDLGMLIVNNISIRFTPEQARILLKFLQGVSKAIEEG